MKRTMNGVAATSGRLFKRLFVLLGLMLLASAAEGQELPWQRGANEQTRPRDLSPRAMLDLLGIDESHWNRLNDGQALESGENETLFRLLYRMPRFEPSQWERWTKSAASLEALAAEPSAHRGVSAKGRGRAQRVEVVKILKELAPLYEFREYYRVTIKSEQSPHPLVVCTRAIPTLWQGVAELDEPVQFSGLFLKQGAAEDDSPLLFVAPRLAWYPDAPQAALHVGADHVWLARQGMDIALWDEVRPRNGSAISAEESECFYQLLRVLDGVEPQAAQKLKAAPFDLAGMLLVPNDLLGKSFACIGTARRVQKVSVPERFRARVGLDHYYEIDLFLPLDKHRIRLTTPDQQAKEPTYTDYFPTTICLTKLPAGLEEGDRVHQDIELKGIFYKLWSYQSDYIEQFNQRQPSPLLMSVETKLLADAAPTGWEAFGPTALLMAIGLGIVAIWWASWRAARGDRQFDRQVLRKIGRGPDATSVGPPENPAG